MGSTETGSAAASEVSVLLIVQILWVFRVNGVVKDNCKYDRLIICILKKVGPPAIHFSTHSAKDRSVCFLKKQRFDRFRFTDAIPLGKVCANTF